VIDRRLGPPLPLCRPILLRSSDAAVVEVIRLGVVDRHGLQDDDPTAEGAPTVPMSVWWQIPQYFLVVSSRRRRLTAAAVRLEAHRRTAPRPW
jgi:hypothetical protein